MSVDVRVEVNEAAVRHVLTDPRFSEHLLTTVNATVVRVARQLAPVRKRGASQGGAASIRGALHTDVEGDFTVRVSWDRTHYYMQFQDLGTVHVPAQHFLERAAEEFGGHVNPAAQAGPVARPRRPRPRRKSSPARRARSANIAASPTQ